MKPTFGAVYEDEMRMVGQGRREGGEGEQKVDSTPSFILAFISSSSPALLLLLLFAVVVAVVFFFGVSFLLFNFRLMSKHRTKSRENIEKNKNRVANVYNYLSLMALCVVCASMSVCVCVCGTVCGALSAPAC